MEKLLETKNYGLFELLKFNRDVTKVRYLMDSMKRHGFIGAYPIHVKKGVNGKLQIKSGHHRFTVAMNLGIPIKYVICQDAATIYELEAATTKWTLYDYLVARSRESDPHAVVVKKYHDETGIPTAQCISMLGGDSAGSGNKGKMFKLGTFRVNKDNKSAAIVRDIVLHCKKEKIEFAANSSFVKALSKIAFVDDFDADRMKKKISSHKPYMEKQRSIDDYLELIDTIYNMRHQNKVPLKFMAEEKARERSAA